MNGLLIACLLLQGTASIEGTVVKAESGEPLAQAQILIAPAAGPLRDSRVTSSDSSGKFSATGLAPGRYRVFFEHDGFIRAEYGQRGTGKAGVPIEIAAGKTTSGIVGSLTAASAIYGRVANSANEPVPNATVKVLKAGYHDGERTLQVVQSSQTNDLGEYRLFGLTPGNYFVNVTPASSPFIQAGTINTPSGNGIAGGQLQNILATGNAIDPRALDGGTDLTVYLPGTTDPAAAAAIDLKPGINFHAADLHTVRVRSFNIRGQLIDSVTGQPPQFALVTLTKGNSTETVKTLMLSQGRPMEFAGVLPGTYVLAATNNGATADQIGSVTVTVGNSNLENVRLSLQPVIHIKGRVVLENSAAPLPGVRVRLRGERGPASAQMDPSAADGSFTVSRLGPGNYRVETIAPMPPDVYIRSARLGNADALNSFAHIEGEVTDPLEIVLSSKTGALDVVVVDRNQRPSVAATAVLIPDIARRQRFDLYKTAPTDNTGHVVWTGVVPGSYKVFAWMDIESNAWQNADVMREYEDRGVAVMIGESAKAAVTVNVIE